MPYLEGVQTAIKSLIIKNKMKNLTKLSKKLAYILRHDPFRFGLKPAKNGFVSIKELCEKAGIKENEIYNLIKNQKKRRFEIKEDQIRALYGHTAIKINYEEIEPPEILFHGTAERNAEKILKEGLKPMKRHYVHLSQSKEDAFIVGKRHDENPVILEINAKKAFEKGVKFYKAGDLYLADYIPPEFIKK